jgi:hypothetical protein
MILAQPITVTPPSITKKDGTVKTFNPITLTELDITIIDNAKRKSVVAQIRPLPMPLVLWSGSDYDSAGDYTQAQVESKITELLGNEPAKALEDLFVPKFPPKGKQ